MNEQENHPIYFGCPAEAVKWSEAFMDGMGERNMSQLGVEIRKRNQKRCGSVDRDGNPITKQRLRFLAETITVILSDVQFPSRELYKHVYGQKKRTKELASILTNKVWDGEGAKKTRSREKMCALAFLTINWYRRSKLYGDKVFYSHMAKNIHVSRRAFNHTWRPYLTKMQNILDDWHEIAEREIQQRLEERRIL